MLKLALLLSLLLLPGGRQAARIALQAVLSVWRPGAGLLAVVTLMGAAVLAIREDWWLAAVLATAGAALAFAARYRARPSAVSSIGRAPAGMTPAEARSILGVSETATWDAIEAAYRRLIRLAHPDRGGTAGLAAQLNAARATLKPRRSTGHQP